MEDSSQLYLARLPNTKGLIILFRRFGLFIIDIRLLSLSYYVRKFRLGKKVAVLSSIEWQPLMVSWELFMVFWKWQLNSRARKPQKLLEFAAQSRRRHPRIADVERTHFFHLRPGRILVGHRCDKLYPDTIQPLCRISHSMPHDLMHSLPYLMASGKALDPSARTIHVPFRKANGSI